MNMKNTYVECLNWTWEEKLLYIKACIGELIPREKLCGHAHHTKEDILNKYTTAKFLYCHDDGMLSYDDISVDGPNFVFGLKRKLTLSDLKPRTKVEYEKVTESIFDLKDEFESGLLFTKKFNQEWHKIKTEEQLGNLLSMNDDPTKNGIYRKVERPVEWWEDAVEFIVENDDDDLSAYFDKQSGGLRVNTNLPRDKWCDFARILLEQEGE